MLPIISGGHSAYQDTFVSDFIAIYPDPFALSKSTWKTITRFWYLDLSLTDSLLIDSYSNFGPLPRQPSCMLRSYLLSIKLRITSITQWCSKLKECPLYAILSGFPVNDTPGIGTFYDFFSRLWASDSNNLSPKERHIKEKTKKGKKRGDKTPLGTKMTCENLLPFLVKQPIQNTHPFQLIFKLYHQQFLNVSVEKGLIDSKQLSIAGDGTPVDSSRECYFNGYHLFMFVASDSFSDLPVFPLLERASRHDMLSFLRTFFSMKAYLPEFNVEKMLLDSAMDAYKLYEYCRKQNIVPFIDLKKAKADGTSYKNDFTLYSDGVPICKMGLRMHHDGIEKAKHRAKFRCPKANRKRGCFCETPCSDAKYGRTVHIQLKDNPRIINIPPRDSKEWKKEYDRRTSAERSNKREKNDYLLEAGKHRSTKMWYCRLYAIMMLQHLDAWEMPSVEDFQMSFSKLSA